MKTLALITGILLLGPSWCGRQQVENIPISFENGEIPNIPTIVRGTIVKREFVDKAGRPRGFSEFYFQIAGEDYYIKFCESNVSRDELERHIDRLAASNPGDNTIALKVEIREGLWMCYDGRDAVPQSRVGQYAVIYEIVESQTGN